MRFSEPRKLRSFDVDSVGISKVDRALGCEILENGDDKSKWVLWLAKKVIELPSIVSRWKQKNVHKRM